MIYNEFLGSRSERTSSYLLRALLARPGVRAPVVREVAMAVEKYLEAESGGRATTISENSLLWMMARALVGAGEYEAACSCLDESLGAGLGPVAVACLRWGERDDVWRLFASGVVRLALCGFDQSPVWILDLSRIHVRDGHFYELSWVPCLCRFTRRVLKLWDVAGRRGLFALRGATALARTLHSRPADRMHCARQIEAVCREEVRRAMDEMGVLSPVRVISLDAPSAAHWRRLRSARLAPKVKNRPLETNE